jgi:hypothetical protein
MRWRLLPVLGLAVALVAAHLAGAETVASNPRCSVANAAGPVAADTLPRRNTNAAKKQKKKKGQQKVSLQPDPQSAGRSVNLGDDREAEVVTLRVNASAELRRGFEKKLDLVAEPFVNTSETGETVTFPEPTFSKLEVSGNRKRITFKMCVNPPNDLPAGKYTSTVMLEGPPPTEAAVMTVTLNAKDGHGFILAAAFTALLAFLVLLYKSAGERRAVAIAAAEKKTEDRTQAMRAAEGWKDPICRCLHDLGWWVPTLASIGAAFALLYAAYDSNPAWGEGGLVTNAIALVGTGLAAVGAKAVFTQSSPSQ